jgi:tRNA-dihydrouridine synthase B
VNGDVRSPAEAVRALAETGCAGVMIGRAAIDHPWIVREARAAIAGTPRAGPSIEERLTMYAALLVENVAARGPKYGVEVTRRHLGILGPLRGALRPALLAARTAEEALAALARADLTRAGEEDPPRAG